MSGRKKSDGTTSRLLEASEEVLKPNSQKYLDIIDSLENSHLAAIRGSVLVSEDDTSIRDAVEADVRSEFRRLRSFMSAAEVIEEITPRTRDIIISCGEKLSARILTAVLESKASRHSSGCPLPNFAIQPNLGVAAKYINLDRLIQQKFDPRHIDQKFYDYLAARLRETVEPFVDTHICVLTGYLGPVPGSLLTTIGRGYTDLTAALVAVGIRAEELQIWKEVDGIFTADPRRAPRARKMQFISPEEAAELTYYGSEVIHPFTMEQVIRASIPIRIKNAFKPEGSGTVILPEGRVMANLSPRSSTGKRSNIRSLPAAATIKENVVILNIHSNRKSVAHGFLAQTFLTLDRFGIVVDLISTSEVHVSMALNPGISEENLESAVAEIRKHATVDVLRDMAILSLVGKQMRYSVGMASLMFSTLAAHNVNIEMISQGASEINISCVIDESNAQTALCAVHDEIILSAYDTTTTTATIDSAE
eukprot:jgi/Hompol1/180/HPOL_005250-RA